MYSEIHDACPELILIWYLVTSGRHPVFCEEDEIKNAVRYSQKDTRHLVLRQKDSIPGFRTKLVDIVLRRHTVKVTPMLFNGTGVS